MRIFKVFLASPSDTINERAIAAEVVNEINLSTGSRDDFRIELLRWENDTYPNFGVDSQNVINTQIGSDYDIFIGVMWKKFGTPTLNADSGTEEEFKIAYQTFQNGGNVTIMFFFNNCTLPHDLDVEQFLKVREFKEKIQSLGSLYKTYETIGEFEKSLRIDLTRCVKDKLKFERANEDSSNDEVQMIVPEINESFSNYLNSLEVNFAHHQVDEIQLEDLYITPELSSLSNIKKNSTNRTTINLDTLTDAVDSDGTKVVILGNDSSGKTANCKYLFKKYFDMGLYPVFIKGNEISSNIKVSTLTEIIENKISEQYCIRFKLKDVEHSRLILIIDDFHKTTKGLNKYWPLLMNNLESLFSNIIIAGHSLMPIENISSKDPFKNFDLYSILEFGPKFRYELVNKWNTLGLEKRFIDPNEVLRKNDAYLSQVRSIIGKNYIPSYPFYILSILQALESGNVQNPNYSIHGFYYEVLINDSFSKAIKDKKEISLYYNYLTHFCFYLFTQKVKDISIEEFDQFHINYCKKHDLTYRKETILETFDSAKLLYVNGRVFIKEKYVYYFFVAKYISNEIGNKLEVKDIVSKMCQRLFRDEYASIIMFVTHLSKDNFVISELIRNANNHFPSSSVAKLEDDISDINKLIENIPTQVLELVDVDQKRNEELDDQEESERLEKELSNDTRNYDDFSLEDDITSIDYFAQITMALKTIDILGQVVKKNWGELEGEEKLNLVMTTYNLGLRTLDFYLQLLLKNSQDIVEHVKYVVEQKHIKDRFSLEKSIEETAKDFVFKLCFVSSFGIIKRISSSIGYDKLRTSFEKALQVNQYNSVKLIDLSIKLGYSSISSHMDELDSYKDDMQRNKLCMVVLRNIVIDYLYMFDTDFKTKSRICDKLGISVIDQLKIEQSSTIKRKG